ncbi:MAG: hypothetical protein HC849_24160 [Oscillatoriales cyanobacterium RU_3_3]|nr:hypothetical protein [Oscillatoriales cyanobacterium RU_3_3]
MTVEEAIVRLQPVISREDCIRARSPCASCVSPDLPGRDPYYGETD